MGVEDRFCGECGFDLKTEIQTEKFETSLGLSENSEAALSYLFGWITGVFVLLFEKKSKFVQFHALQSTTTFLVLSIMISLFSYSYSIWWLLFILEILLWALLMYKAYTGEKYKLPIVGDFAERHSKV